jgi:hypothetical protein
MLLRLVKSLATAFFIFGFTVFARAQQTHFVYLQTESGQPFYVKINNKVVSSSPAGYLILPKLSDGDYKLNIGFPKKEFPEENFQILIDKKNEGYLLKNFGEKGWGLFNMQSYRVVMGGTSGAIASSPKNLQDDPFSRMLANVVKDSAILEKKEPLKEVEPVTAKVDSSVAIVEKSEPLLSPATRFLSKKNKEGMEMIYIDRNQNGNDTIRIFIPSEKPIINTENVDAGVVQNPKLSNTSLPEPSSVMIEQPVTSQMKSDTSLVVALEKKNMVENKDSVIPQKMEEVMQPKINSQDSVIKPGVEMTKKDEVKKDEVKKDDVKKDDVKKNDVKKDEIVVLPKVVQSSTINSDCKAFAANEDFLKLRKKMASENSEDNMIKIAKKAFHSKCFSTEQIKNLSFLFLTNSGKYMFFDLAYPFASDSDQYNTLESQLTDSYYLNRFKAMIHK